MTLGWLIVKAFVLAALYGVVFLLLSILGVMLLCFLYALAFGEPWLDPDPDDLEQGDGEDGEYF